jgi:prepilin-type N-terminal cleavage/methylation domain-containing protein
MKNNNKGFTLIEILLCLQIVVILVFVTAWCVNLYKLTQCDFEPSYKGEVIHAVGLIGPAAIVTVWFDHK